MNRKFYLILFLIFLFFFIGYSNYNIEKFNSVKFSEIYIVYFIYIDKNRNWQTIVEGQMQDIKETNILKNNKLFVVISCEDYNLTQKAIDIINNILAEHINNISFTIETRNLFEYPGIKKVHELALVNKDKIFIYFHSKGMTFHNNKNERLNDEKLLTKYTFKNWENTLNLFNNDPSMKKAGLFPGYGFIWYNFWWATGEYISTIEEPIITGFRYYYEYWLCNSNLLDKNKYWVNENERTLETIKNDSYSLIHNKNKSLNMDEAVREMHGLAYYDFNQQNQKK